MGRSSDAYLVNPGNGNETNNENYSASYFKFMSGDDTMSLVWMKAECLVLEFLHLFKLIRLCYGCFKLMNMIVLD